MNLYLKWTSSVFKHTEWIRRLSFSRCTCAGLVAAPHHPAPPCEVSPSQANEWPFGGLMPYEFISNSSFHTGAWQWEKFRCSRGAGRGAPLCLGAEGSVARGPTSVGEACVSLESTALSTGVMKHCWCSHTAPAKPLPVGFGIQNKKQRLAGMPSTKRRNFFSWPFGVRVMSTLKDLQIWADGFCQSQKKKKKNMSSAHWLESVGVKKNSCKRVNPVTKRILSLFLNVWSF